MQDYAKPLLLSGPQTAVAPPPPPSAAPAPAAAAAAPITPPAAPLPSFATALAQPDRGIRRPPGGEMGWLPAALVAGGILGGFLLFNRVPISAPHRTASSPAVASAAEPPPPAPSAAPIAEALFNLTAPRWPAAFDAPPPPGDFRIPARLLPRYALADMQKTYGFYVGQSQVARLLAGRFPALKADLGEAQSQFEAKYGPAVGNIDSLVSEWNAPTARQMHETAGTAAHRVDVSRLSLAQARAYAAELRKRTRGHLPSPMAETFLAFDPVYATNPVREFDDGFVNTYRAPSEGAAGGLRIAFVYPRSWQPAPGAGLLVQHFHDRRSGLSAATISADYLPNSSITRPQQLRSMLTLVDVLESAPDAKLLDAGIVVLPDGQQALWRECTFTQTRGNAPYRMKAVDFTLVCGEKYVNVGFSAGVDASAPEAALDSAYRRNAPLYKRMICDASVGG
ncbi:MAG TPA: hypothetical protein VGI81_02490 [Tepidisphaeraceae bacterium]